MLVEVLIHTPRLIPLMAQYISSNYQFLFLFFTIIILFRKQFYLMHFLGISAWTSEDAFTKYEVLLFIRHPLPFMSGCLSSMVKQIFFSNTTQDCISFFPPETGGFFLVLFFLFSLFSHRVGVLIHPWLVTITVMFSMPKNCSFYSTVIICKFYFAWI